jgi:uncharacterized membrane protein YeaQ/YmgE (transglycosylase-associated protein family)
MFIGLISWIIVGMIVGFIASKNVNLRGDDPKLGLACGVIGATSGGILYRIVSGVALGFTFWSIASAAIGAVVVVVAWHIMRRRSARA